MKIKIKAIVLILGLLLFINPKISAQQIPERKGVTHVKIALQSYSFTKMLNDHLKNSEKGISLEDFLEFSATNNFEAVELTGYFFSGYPETVPTDEYIYKIKRKAFNLGLSICGTGVRNDFANPDPLKRAADVKLVKDWVDVAVKLGAPIVRIFSGASLPSGSENKWDSVADYMALNIRECADYARSKGIMIGVQNHGDFLKTADETIKLVKLVHSDAFGVILDTGYFLTPDPYVDMEKLMPYALNFLLKESPVPGGSMVKMDLPRVMKIIKKSGFRGYMPIETLSAKGPSKNNPRSSEKKPAYDPYKVIPEFVKDVRVAVNNEFGTE
jgi:sugar phosphate isomerase/epimerase